MSFEIIKQNFDRQLWTVVMVRLAVIKGIISESQFEEITGASF